MPPLTHTELIQLTVSHCWDTMNADVVMDEVAAKEIGANLGEQCDVLMFKSYAPVVFECKVSDTDRKADARKTFRQKPEAGMGVERYLCILAGEDGIVRTDCVEDSRSPHYQWGLNVCRGREIQRVVPSGIFRVHNHRAETSILVAALKRLQFQLGRDANEGRAREKGTERERMPMPHAAVVCNALANGSMDLSEIRSLLKSHGWKYTTQRLMKLADCGGIPGAEKVDGCSPTRLRLKASTLKLTGTD